MARAFSSDLRERIVKAYENREGTTREIAQRFAVGKTFVNNVVRRFRQTGTSAAYAQGGSSPLMQAEHQEFIVQMLEENNDATLSELCDALERQTGLKVSLSTMCRVLQQQESTLKKNISC